MNERTDHREKAMVEKTLPPEPLPGSLPSTSGALKGAKMMVKERRKKERKFWKKTEKCKAHFLYFVLLLNLHSFYFVLILGSNILLTTSAMQTEATPRSQTRGIS